MDKTKKLPPEMVMDMLKMLCDQNHPLLFYQVKTLIGTLDEEEFSMLFKEEPLEVTEGEIEESEEI